MFVLGIGGLNHDGAAALLGDEGILAAMEEEKITRNRRGQGLPIAAIEACLAHAGVRPSDIDVLAIARPMPADPAFHLDLRRRFPSARIVVVDHHQAHAASAFYPSPFEEATVLTLDRWGDGRCGARWHAQGYDIRAEKELLVPDSPALLFSRLSDLLGFRGGIEDHKVQWMSAGGTPRFADAFRRILRHDASLGITIDHSYFDAHRRSEGGFNEKFFNALGISHHDLEDDRVRADLAAALQKVIEEVVPAFAERGTHLCLAGGLMLNSMLVDAIERSGRFEDVWVQPVAGNAGTSLGAALHAWHRTLGRRERIRMNSPFLGSAFDLQAIKQVLDNCKLRFRYLMTDRELLEAAVERLSNDKIVAWFQGRTEWGPRALGNRSIFASPKNPYSTENLNVYIKHREPFRKFAASVPAETASTYFELGTTARYLASIGRVRPEYRATFSAAMLDETRIRVHAVRQEDNRLCWELLHAAGRATGLPVLYNTSFNLFAEPLVNDPRSAVRSFYASGIDALFIGNFALEK